VFILSEYKLVRKNENENIFIVVSGESIYCPICEGPLEYRDSRKRIWKVYGGKVNHICADRMYCERCHRLHTILPDILTPHKHYGKEVIENVLDDVCTSEDLSTENYPCEKTMERWKNWFVRNKQNIEGFLQSVRSRLEEHLPILLGIGTLLKSIREEGAGWLALITKMVINLNHCFCT
jgi:uncharacterized protein YbaR (Trm112 family)